LFELSKKETNYVKEKNLVRRRGGGYMAHHVVGHEQGDGAS
jgi:hypothetical protein